MKVGDKVGYVPHEVYANHQDPLTKEMAWVRGRKVIKEGKEVHEELHGEALTVSLRECVQEGKEVRLPSVWY